jgi:hypothetical protein
VLGREVDVYEGVSRECHRQRALQVRPEPGMHRKAVKDIDDLPVNEVRPEVYAVAVYHKAEVGRAREKPPVVGQHTVSGPSVVRPYLGVRESEAKGLQNTGDFTCRELEIVNAVVGQVEGPLKRRSLTPCRPLATSDKAGPCRGGV